MQKPYKETAVANIPKEELAYFNGDSLKYTDFLIKQLLAQLSERIMTVLLREGEVVARLSDLRVEAHMPTNSMEYKQQIEWSPLVRCKDCKHRPSGDEWNHDIEFPDDLCPCQCEDFWNSWIPKDDWFCGNGEKRE